MPASIFARLIERLDQYEGDVIGFQIGDTHLAPPLASRLGALAFSAENDPELYRYCKAHGDMAFIEAVVDKLRHRNGFDFVTADNVQITSGATHALSCAVRGVLNPGDEILLLSPYWPLIRGIAVSAGVTPIEVPVGPAELGASSIGEQIERMLTPKVSALYMTTPSNPDGKVLTHEQLREIAEIAERNDLWIISDEVYEEFVYDGLVHQSLATLPGMAGRTLTAFSFSKSYGLAGLRVGYLVGPEDAIGAARKMVGHTIYSVPRAMQRSALKALQEGQPFLEQARATYQRARDMAVERIVAPCPRPQGATYLFLDLRPWSEPGSGCAFSVLEKIAEAGVLLAPGAAFGSAYSEWARLCFTAVESDKLVEGIDRINDVLESIGRR